MVPFRTFRGPLFPKPVTGQELFLAVSYSKAALEKYVSAYLGILQIQAQRKMGSLPPHKVHCVPVAPSSKRASGYATTVGSLRREHVTFQPLGFAFAFSIFLFSTVNFKLREKELP